MNDYFSGEKKQRSTREYVLEAVVVDMVADLMYYDRKEAEREIKDFKQGRDE